jgi:hypothetical protein
MQERIMFKNIKEIPTDLLAHNLVASLIVCEGNLKAFQEVIAYLLRELRNEPHPEDIKEAVLEVEAVLEASKKPVN